MPHPITPIPRGTNQNPWVRDLPFLPDTPFADGGLGVLMNTGAVADPAASAYRHLLSQATRKTSGGLNAPGDMFPVANPTDLGAGYFWCQMGLEPSDQLVIRPYVVLYSSSAHTALASAAAADAISATLSIWTVHHVGPNPQNGQYREFAAEFIGQVTVANAATRINSGTRYLPTGAQFCYSGSVGIDKSLAPGIRFKGDSAGGAMEIIFDQQGAEGYIIQASSLTASSGVGWLRRSI